ncbi:YchJ family protein [Flavobacterium sp. TMP13]|uniref:YchJ family protein n=1 Tax=Flavobacterium sp. TMP13 TaxID=3425950 RepID=UPI003D76E1EE
MQPNNLFTRQKICYCDTGLLYEQCCGLYHTNKKAPTALALMRSRYSAFASHNADYLMETTYGSERKNYSKEAILEWSTANEWILLEIIKFTENTVEFKAFYTDENQVKQIHHEFSTFIMENAQWYFLKGE